MNIEEILAYIVGDDHLHVRFLNTLSLQENIGARKISASEEPQTTTYMVLKHAAEEHRHAFYLKKQMERLLPGACPTYEPEYLLSPRGSRFYLNRLDLETCRYLKENMNLYGAGLKFAAYLLVTYAIEVRADIIYPLYQQALDSSNSRISVRSIIAEEQGHLEEMIVQLQIFSPDWQKHAEHVIAIENRIYGMWIDDLAKDLLK